MARWEPHSATAEFYINLKDNPHLDFREKTEAGWGYCVFGKVVAGMEVVETIAALPTEARGQLHALPQETVLLHRVSPVDPEP
jgi:peptidyl-prolyl cis-trans isomerase B (cyclophilin B)